MRRFILLFVLAAGCERAATSSQEPRSTQSVKLAASALVANPIASARAEMRKLAGDLLMVGSVTYDADHVAIVGPLAPGRIAKLHVGLGDRVKPGQILADIESADVGAAQAAYLSAKARAAVAQTNLNRERELAAQHISSERDRETAEAQSISETAELRAATERMRALGITDGEIADLARGQGTGGRARLRSPIAGVVISRSVALGQSVERATDAFKVANLERLWVLLDLYEKDLERVRVGQKVQLRTESLGDETFDAQVEYVNPVIDEKTRTASVRIEFSNRKNKLRPGQFVTAKLFADPNAGTREVLAIPRTAVQTIDGKNYVFVRADAGFNKREVTTGVLGGDWIEARSGVTAGDDVVTDGAFLLKSEVQR